MLSVTSAGVTATPFIVSPSRTLTTAVSPAKPKAPVASSLSAARAAKIVSVSVAVLLAVLLSNAPAGAVMIAVLTAS